jgi:hypothetical protein
VFATRRSIARRRAMIRFSFSSAPALPDQAPKRPCFIGARRPRCGPAERSPALSIGGMQRDGRRAPITVIPEAVTKPESMTRGRAPRCRCYCAPKPGGSRFAQRVRRRGTICTSGPAGLKRKTPAAFQATGVILLITEIARTGKNPHGFI